MTLDVSLCVIRVERSKEGEKSKDASTEIPANKCEAEIIRGRRNISDITIETYVSKQTDPNVPNKLIPQVEKPEMACSSSSSEDTRVDLQKKDSAIHFIAGNPFVETFQGIIHLFKEDELTDIEQAGRRSQTVCILAVPANMTCSDLLTFIAACHDDIKHVRIIKDSSPNQYMALITFRTPRSVIEFYNSFNGIPFNNLEPEWCCHLVFVSRVESVGEDEGASVPPVAHTELPTCPVCLERMDESVDGILTILCNHAFHGSCLAKWGDTSCPVCRHVQTPEPVGENFCLECNATESLWICLICGHVGCGRYLQGHAYQHYIDTQHCYSMQLGSNSVWDYVGDNFVHRILQNKTDGKLVEAPNPEKLVEVKAKISSIQLEYTYLLTSQLESQRTYYEEMLSSWKENAEDIAEQNEKLENALKEATQEKSSLEKKYQSLMNKYSTIQKALSEEKELNSAISKNQAVWKEKFSDLEKDFNKFKIDKSLELDDVKEQLRDVMFYLKAQQVISENSDREEIMEGRVEIGAPSTERKKSRSRRQKRH